MLPTAKTELNDGVVIVLSSTYFFVAKFRSAVGAIPVTKPVNVAVVPIILFVKVALVGVIVKFVVAVVSFALAVLKIICEPPSAPCKPICA